MNHGELKRIKLADIVPSASNPRKNFETADWPDFVENVRQRGVLQPGVGRAHPSKKGKIELVAGERRYRASGAAKLEDMPLMIMDLTDAEVIEIQQIENLQREGLSPLEEAQGYADWRDSLIKAGTCKTVEEAVAHICGKITRKRSAVFQRLALLKTSPEVQKAVRSGRLDVSKAQLIAQLADPKAQGELLEAALEPDWNEELPSYRDLQEMVEEDYQVSLKDAPFDLKATYTGDVKMEGGTLMLFPRGSCENCKLRTGNMVEQFPELKSKPNVCTQPACYKGKIAAAAKVTADAAAAKGKTVLSEADFNKQKTKFVRGDATNTGAQYRYGENWSTIMGKHKPNATLVATADGLLTVYPKDEAVKSAKKNGVSFPGPRRKEQSNTDRQEKEKKREELRKNREALVKSLASKLGELLNKLPDATAWKVLEKLVRGNQWNSARLGLKGTTPRDQVLIRVFNEDTPVTYEGAWEQTISAAWKLVGIDLAAEEQRLAALAKKTAATPPQAMKKTTVKPTKKGKK